MKRYLILAFFLVFLASLFYFFEVRSTSFTSHDITNNTLSATRENAEEALNSSQKIIEEMEKTGLPVLYVQDRLIEATSAFSNENYPEVLLQHGKIIERRREALIVFDSLELLRKEIEQENDAGVDTADAEVFLSSAEGAFKEDRLDDSRKLIEQTRNVLDDLIREASLDIAFTGAIINFIKRYFVLVALGLIMLFILSRKYYKKTRKKFLANRIERLKNEKKVIFGLMKETQFERYKRNNMSGLVYNIRMDSYKDRASKIDQLVPVLESELKKLDEKKQDRELI